MKALLLDLNVILDVVLDRPPGVVAAAALWAALERGDGVGFIPAHGVTTIFYVLEEARGARFARQGVERHVERGRRPGAVGVVLLARRDVTHGHGAG